MPDPFLYDEKELLLRIAEGDEQGFADFFRQQSPIVDQWIRRLVRDESGTDEVLQDVFIQLWMYRDKLADVQHLIPWLRTVTTHQCFKYLTRRKAYYLRTAELLEQESTAFMDGGAEAHLNYQEVQSIIRQALTTLTPQQRQIFHMSREEGMNSDEIARALTLSRGHVRNTISAVLTLLRQHLLQSGKISFIGWLIFIK